MGVIFRFRRYTVHDGERSHATLEAAIADAAGTLASGDAFPYDIVSDAGDVVLDPGTLLRRLRFGDRQATPGDAAGPDRSAPPASDVPPLVRAPAAPVLAMTPDERAGRAAPTLDEVEAQILPILLALRQLGYRILRPE